MARPNSSRGGALALVRKCRVVTVNAPAVLVERVQIRSDPHQSPFWIKAMGLLHWGVDTLPLAQLSPRKSSVPHQGPSGTRRRGWGASADPRSSRRSHPIPAGPWHHRSLARRRSGVVQPGIGSMAEASRSHALLPNVGRGMRRSPIRSGGLSPTPLPGLPTHRPIQAKARLTSKSLPSRSMW